MEIKAARGTKDIYGTLALKFQAIIQASELFKRHGFEQMITPIFENTALFTRGIGETTDIVEKEMYTFDDKGGRSLTLRPEGTASVVRAYGEHKLYQEGTQKFFYHGPMFRYERPQAGRYREFYQMGVEVIGESDSSIDVEVIAMADNFLNRLGIKNYEIQINTLGCGSCRSEYQEALKSFLRARSQHLCEDCLRRLEKNPLRVLDCKVPTCREQFTEVPLMVDFLDEVCQEHFSQVQAGLDALNIAYRVNRQLVRGLDYYQRTVFEFVSTQLGAQGTILGGGRYNQLVGEICETIDQPAIGFAAGMERMAMLMEEVGQNERKVAICWQAKSSQLVALQLKVALAKEGITTLMSYEEKSFKAQFKQANKQKVDFALIIGEEEMSTKQVKVKNFMTQEEYLVAQQEVIKFIKEA